MRTPAEKFTLIRKKLRNKAYQKSKEKLGSKSKYDSNFEQACFDEYAFAKEEYEKVKTTSLGKSLVMLKAMEKYGTEWLAMLPGKGSSYNRHKKIIGDLKEVKKNIKETEAKLKKLDDARLLASGIADENKSILTNGARQKEVLEKLAKIREYKKLAKDLPSKSIWVGKTNELVNQLEKRFLIKEKYYNSILGDGKKPAIDFLAEQITSSIEEFEKLLVKDMSDWANVEALRRSRDRLIEQVSDWDIQYQLQKEKGELVKKTNKKIFAIKKKFMTADDTIEEAASKICQSYFKDEVSKKALPFKKITLDNLDKLYDSISDFRESADEYTKRTLVLAEIPELIGVNKKSLAEWRTLTVKIELAYQKYEKILLDRDRYLSFKTKNKEDYLSRVEILNEMKETVESIKKSI